MRGAQRYGSALVGVNGAQYRGTGVHMLGREVIGVRGTHVGVRGAQY